MQFPGMVPLQFAQSPSMAQQLQGLGQVAQKLGAQQTSVVPTAGTPTDISPAATNAGTNVQQPGIMDAIKGLTPQGILDKLRTMSAGGGAVIPQGMPGSAALQGAGMLSNPAVGPLGPLY